MQRLGIYGAGEHKWTSVDRTRRFYLRALAREFDIVLLETPEDVHRHTSLDAVLSFSGSSIWELAEPPPCPRIFALHGGTVLDHAVLRRHLACLRTSDALIVNCTSDIAILQSLVTGPGPRICQLPLPVNTQLFQPGDREECRAALPLGDSEGAGPPDYLLGFVARLLPQKNLHGYLRLLAALSRRLAPRTVAGVIIGAYWIDYPVLPYVTAGYRDYIAALVRELGLEHQVVYLGAGLEDEDLAMCYGAMDVLVHPTSSLDENFGYVPVEAMACGTPVVGAAYGGLKDTVISGQTGYLMPTWVTGSGIRMDIMAGQHALERMLLDHDARAAMAARAAEHAHARYTEDVCGRILCDAIAETIAAYRAGAGQPVAIMPVSPTPASTELLPPLAVPWEHYRDVVAHYVSGAIPTLIPSSRLQLAAPVRTQMDTDGSGWVALDDPAWPAKFRLQANEMALALRCSTPVSVAELMHESPVERTTLERMVSEGLLLCSNE